MQPPIPQPPQDPRRQVAADRLAERRARVHRIRMRATAGAVALFIAAFAGLYVQLASGDDPALAKHTRTTTTAAPPASTAHAPDTAPSAVTTGQS